jgi:hypothetical protein
MRAAWWNLRARQAVEILVVAALGIGASVWLYALAFGGDCGAFASSPLSRTRFFGHILVGLCKVTHPAVPATILWLLVLAFLAGIIWMARAGRSTALPKTEPSYVRTAEGPVVVYAADQATVGTLVALGFSRRGSAEYARQSSGDAETAEIFEALRDAQVCFSIGREWNPAEIFEDLRERGLLSGKYRRISFSGPGKWFVNER